ncbi:MAG: hypothetical protein HOP07_01025 [Bacteriovoracaceae bacterium]|nr:hypothetical protein [Bacteriovoracaceae bacterium]
MILGFISMSLIAFGFDRVLNDQMKRFSLILSISVITLFLYQATFVINFHAVQWGVIFVAVLVAMMNLIKSKERSILDFLKRN